MIPNDYTGRKDWACRMSKANGDCAALGWVVKQGQSYQNENLAVKFGRMKQE